MIVTSGSSPALGVLCGRPRAEASVPEPARSARVAGGCGLAGGPRGRRLGDGVSGGDGMAGRRVNVNVGVLGHIDSGKTALARALSTTASTAAFDKQPQSRERGITLDLGFSCFVVPLPGAEPGTSDTLLQVTLVDCPGHASLIRTIIGGERGPGREPGSGQSSRDGGLTA